MYKTILVPIDIFEDTLTDKALKHAVYLAKTSDATIHLFHLIPDVSKFSMIYSYYYDLLSSSTKEATERSEKKLHQLIKKINYPLNKIFFKVDIGSPKEKVLSQAEQINADLIIIGSHNPSVLTHLLGSNALCIVSYTKRSVLVIR
ncbi:Universal stress protein G [Candidatus Providencia siddallii]|uniref:Universal stress protein n=1 Tax=Candidatus Providencia siddallii TaxID=1715285 RepID=A0A0M6W7E8_9GAMM|nr:Universal stress protein G [Candidatus Providencia siddallii]